MGTKKDLQRKQPTKFIARVINIPSFLANDISTRRMNSFNEQKTITSSIIEDRNIDSQKGQRHYLSLIHI